MNPKLLLPVFLSCFAVPAGAQLSETPLPQEDVSAIRAVWQEWCDAALAGDLDRFARVYSDHAVEVFASGQSNTSRANVAVRARPWFVNGTFTSCANDISLLEGAGGTAFAVAANTQSWVNSQSQRTTEYVFTLWSMMKKESDGEWRFLVMHWAEGS
jgi:uncharacterized protein (TIGR02246 family)